MKWQLLILAIGLVLPATAAVCGNDPLCQACSKGACTYCAYGYANSNGTCVAASSVSGCYSYNSSTVCSACNPGYFQNTTTGTCTAFNATFGAICAFAWTNATFCDQCRNNGLFNAQTKTCDLAVKCVDAQCGQCYMFNGAQVCAQCNSGYAIWSSTGYGSTCVATTVQGCWATNSTTSCLYCNAGYYLNANGTCTASAALAYKDGSLKSSSAGIVNGLVALLLLMRLY